LTPLFRDELLEALEAFSPALTGSRFERGDGYVLASYPTFPTASMNAVCAVGAGRGVVADLASLLDGIEANGVPAGVTIFDGEAPELEHEARRLGFTERREIPGMVATRSTFRPADDAELDVVVAVGEEQRAQALDVVAAGFGFPRAWGEDFYSPSVLDAGGTIYLGLASGRPVTTALSFGAGQGIGIFNVATPAEHRGRGYGAAVTSRAVADALEAGAAYVWLQSSSSGFGVYQRLGFETVSTAELWVRPDADTTGV
jgi:ribosomal protein S18 acetylase RimI-like enzyme